LLGVKVTRLRIKKLDLVNDTTIVDVCFKVQQDRATAENSTGHPELAEMVRGQR
jgi:tRNA (Thr-GGU) A37 N-methylase